MRRVENSDFLSRILLLFLVTLFAARGVAAVEIIDPLTTPKLNEAWMEQLSTGGKPTITCGPAGLTIKCEPKLYAMVKRRNELVGTDVNPLSISCHIITESGFQTHPALHIYWDNDNYISLLAASDNHFHVTGRINGNPDFTRPFYHVVPDSKKVGSYVRAVLLDRNVLVSISPDGVNWRQMCSLGWRPKTGVAPPRIILGRGWAHERGNKDAKPDLANDYYPDNTKQQITSTFRDFRIKDTPGAVPAEPLAFEAKDDWEKTLDSLDAAGVPRAWTMLGPLPDRDFKKFKKEGLEPDETDNWNPPPKDDTGRPFRATPWQRPEDDFSPYVDLSEIIEPNTNVIAYARTDVDWPVDGPACLWFDDNGRAIVYVNNRKVFSDEGRDNRTGQKDRFCIPVQLKKGRNVIKIKTAQARGDWGFYLRIDRNDPGYRILLLERLMQLHPKEAAGWRGAHALLEIARRYEQLEDFPRALAAWQKALDALASVDEFRIEALEGRLRLQEELRDWPGVLATGEKYLAAYPQGPGAQRAIEACVQGEARSGKMPAAEARVAKIVEQAGKDVNRIVWAYRLLAGAAENAGQRAAQYAALEKLADNPHVDSQQRARAAFESAFNRVHIEFQRITWPQSQPLDTAPIEAACRVAQKGIDLLPGGSNPQVKEWLKDVQEDLKAGRHGRAVSSCWGAALMAMCASDEDSAPLLALHKSYKLPDIGTDPATKKPRELSDQLRNESWGMLAQVVDNVKWSGWKAIGPFDNTDGAGERVAYGPEKSPDFAAKHPGKGGDKAWVDIDPKAWHDLGKDLKPVLGDCKNGIAYVAADFEVPDAREMTLYLALRAGWVAYLDNQEIGSKTEDWYRIDGNRIPVKLSAGKHRLMLKLFAPADEPFTFRVRLSNEPELALNILRFAWLHREFCPLNVFYNMHGDMAWLNTYLRGKLNTDTLRVFSEAYASVYCAHWDIRWSSIKETLDFLIAINEHSDAADGYRELLMRLQTWGEYPERSSQIAAASRQLCEALLNAGEVEAGDQVLQALIARYPNLYGPTGAALVTRGTLRWDFGLSQECRPYFERAIREYPQADYNYRLAAPGLAFGRGNLPERIQFETSNDIQTQIDAATRQMKTGDPLDIERAMRNLSDAIRTGPGGMIRISDSRFAPLYVGVREYFRALLAALPDDMRQIYLKTVADISQQRYHKAADQSSLQALEGVAGEFHYTPAAAQALNHAGNLYMDRGAYAQAAAAFKFLLQEYRGIAGVAEPMLSAKMARALLLDGQTTAAKVAAEQLVKEFGAQTINIGGKPVGVSQYASSLLEQIGKAASAGTGNADENANTFLSNIQRTGPPVHSPAPKPGTAVWSRQQVQSASMDYARSSFWPDPYNHVGPYPAVANGRVFVGAMEGLQALDLITGKTLWRQAWGGAGSLLPRQFTGFPVSCPTVSEGRVYLRVMNGKQSALHCYNAENGRLFFSTETIPELKRLIWLSDPIIAYGLAVAVFVEVGDRNVHGVAAVDAQTGRFRWKRDLVMGSTGIRYGSSYLPSSMQLGPPAADRGTIYTPTGMNSLAAMNAFTGEVVWVSGYLRMQTGNAWDGAAGNSGNLRNRVMKQLARGPASPIVAEEVVIVSPKDAAGVMAFDRRTGLIRWRDELLDSRYFAGMCDGNILAVDNTVKAIGASGGNVAWEYSLQGERLFGQPGYSGGILYVPTETSLQMIDAHTGKLVSSTPWDPRVGPLSNLAITSKLIVGSNETHTVALGLAGAPKVELPLQEAQTLAGAGKLEPAAEFYAKAARSADADDIMTALSGWVGVLEKLGKKEEALTRIDEALADKPATLESSAAFWKVAKNMFADGLRTRLGQPPPTPPAPKDGLSGSLVYAWQLEGENPRLVFPNNGAQDRFYAWAGSNLYAVRLSAKFELLWQVYVGPDATGIDVGPTAVAVATPQKLVVVDRETGQFLWQTQPPTDKRRRLRHGASTFGAVAIDADSVAVTSGDWLVVYDLRTKKERWSNTKQYRKCMLLEFINGKLIEFCSNVDKAHERDRNVTTYDPQNGNKLDNIPFGKGAEWVYNRVSPDGRYLFCRPNPHVLAAVDLQTGKKIWQTSVPNLDPGNWHWTNLKFNDGLLCYAGEARDGPDKGWMNYVVNPEDGKILRKLSSGGPVGQSILTFKEAYNKVHIRSDDDGKGGLKEVWRSTLPDHYMTSHYGMQHYLFDNRLYSFYIRSGDGNSDQYVLRTMDWQSGQVLSNEFLPGAPIRDYGSVFRHTVYQKGDLLLYSGADGIFAYAPLAATRTDSVAKLKETLASPALPPAQRRETRRALLAIDPPTLQAFLAPQESKADGDFSEWANTEPLVVDEKNYVPLRDDAPAAANPQDLSAKIYSAWNTRGVYLAVDVRDDHFSAPLPGTELDTGDSIRVVVNSTSSPWYGFYHQETLACDVALVDGRTVLNSSREPLDLDDPRVDGRVVRSGDGRGARYEVFMPWELLRREGWWRPGDRKEMRLGIAVFDDDGDGVKGAVEWGAGVTSPTFAGMRLGQLSLLDISREKIERYRKVIDILPDSPEAMRFLELVLLSKRGATAENDRVAELEAFVKAHPKSPNNNRALSLLRGMYTKAGVADSFKKVTDLASAAKCPPEIIDNIRNKVFRVWAYTDPKNPPNMIMIQFHWKNWGWVRRAYWGAPSVDWGRDNTSERRPMGALPKPGVWTLLEIQPVDLEMEEADMTGIAFTSFGGQTWFDRATVVVEGKETVVLDDALPNGARVDGNPLQFVDNQKHDGAKSWTAGASTSVLNPSIMLPDTWFSFRSPAPPKSSEVDIKTVQGFYRQASRILPDTPEGLAFLNKVLSLVPRDNAVQGSIEECESYLKQIPDTQHALEILKYLHRYYSDAGDKKPMARCEELLQKVKLSRDNCRAFYQHFSPSFTDYHVLGPFQAVGERRGLDFFMQPEKGVDLTWTTKGIGEIDQSWTKITFNKDDKARHGDPGYVDLHQSFMSKLDKQQRSQVERGPYFGYAYVKINVPSKRRAMLLYGANDALSIWVNGNRVVNEAIPGNGKDREGKIVWLNRDVNEILIKVGIMQGRLGFYFRVADENGRPFDDLTFP